MRYNCPHLSEYTQRRLAIGSALKPRKLDALIVTCLANVRYLSGFTGSNGALLISAGGCELFTDPRYELQASQEADCRVRAARGPLLAHLMAVVQRKKFRRLGFEKFRISWDACNFLAESLSLGAALEPVAGLIEELRMVKSASEIALIRQSMAICDAAFEATLTGLRAGVSERDVAAELDYQIRRRGADGAAFETIVAAGARSALPHAHPTDNPLRNKQLVLIDVGASQAGYCSDMTRTMILGRAGTKARRLYQAVAEAQASALAAVRPGVTAASVDRAARRVLARHGLEREFAHATGHGLGLEIHEPPRLGKRERIVLQPGMVITVEPGAYLTGFGGVRIEDTVLVTAGGAEVLTTTSKDLRAL
jgi:Xaa-Pro aminopeptidase